jgi:hypothetical protein
VLSCTILTPSQRPNHWRRSIVPPDVITDATLIQGFNCHVPQLVLQAFIGRHTFRGCIHCDADADTLTCKATFQTVHRVHPFGLHTPQLCLHGRRSGPTLGDRYPLSVGNHSLKVEIRHKGFCKSLCYYQGNLCGRSDTIPAVRRGFLQISLLQPGQLVR